MIKINIKMFLIELCRKTKKNEHSKRAEEEKRIGKIEPELFFTDNIHHICRHLEINNFF